jgi:hypothetical protein
MKYFELEVNTVMSIDPRSSYDAIAEELSVTTPTTRGQMFGMPCLKNNGKAFAGFFQDIMVFKLGAPYHAEALALAGSHLFDPSERGRPMKEWVVVPVEHSVRWLEFAQKAFRYVDGIGR